MSNYRIALGLTRQFAKMRNPPVCRQFSAQAPLNNAAPKPANNTSTFKLALIGASIGVASGTAYSIYDNWQDKHAHMEHERTAPTILKELPAGLKITKRYINPKDTSGLELVLFQFQTCPFCCKVRAFLDYMGISYAVVEVDAVLRQDIKWSNQKKVPLVLIRQRDGKYVQMSDSSAIISLVASYMNDRRNDIGELAQFYPTTSYFDDFGKKKHDIVNKYFQMYQERTPKNMTPEILQRERKWRTWADNHLVHLISPNCYQTIGEAFETFNWFSNAGEWDVHFPRWERDLMVYVGATAMWGISKVLKRRHNLTNDVRAHIYEALDKWMNELQSLNTKFMGGKEPNLADLSVYGVLNSMEGCQAFKDCLQNTNIGEWYYAVKEIIVKNRGVLKHERMEGQAPSELNPIPA